MKITLNPAETNALVRSIEGLEDLSSVELEHRDLFDQAYPDRLLIVTVNWSDGGRTSDAISDTGETTNWQSTIAPNGDRS